MLKVPTQPLIDGVRRNAANPLTFEIPSAVERTSLTLKQSIKIGVEGTAQHGGEKFWAEVVEILDGPRYRVRVDNDLVHVAGHGLDYNDIVEIEPRHVLSVR